MLKHELAFPSITRTPLRSAYFLMSDCMHVLFFMNSLFAVSVWNGLFNVGIFTYKTKINIINPEETQLANKLFF